MKINSKILSLALYELIKEAPENYEKIIDIFSDFCYKNNFISILPKISKNIEYLLDKNNIKNDLFITDKTEKKDIEIILNRLNVSDANITVDNNLISGFIFKKNNVLYDASLKSQIKKIKEIMNN
ncbi:F0F1 ATP synthase subunit delta [Patescibacteria group bacterium]|nr:F0F1 ATP synthase subunit delta [Patescibacteria group bacterium]